MFNIKSNRLVFVQQSFIKKYFEDNYNISNVVVKRPDSNLSVKPSSFNFKSNDNYYFLFPINCSYF